MKWRQYRSCSERSLHGWSDRCAKVPCLFPSVRPEVTHRFAMNVIQKCKLRKSTRAKLNEFQRSHTIQFMAMGICVYILELPVIIGHFLYPYIRNQTLCSIFFRIAYDHGRRFEIIKLQWLDINTDVTVDFDRIGVVIYVRITVILTLHVPKLC